MKVLLFTPKPLPIDDGGDITFVDKGASCFDELKEDVRETNPDALLYDWGSPTSVSSERAAFIRETFPNLAIIVFRFPEYKEYVDPVAQKLKFHVLNNDNFPSITPDMWQREIQTAKNLLTT